MIEQKAKLTLMIVKEMVRKPIKLCRDCFKKVCDEQECGSEDYVERQARAYIGADKYGSIKIGVAPFHDDKIPKLEEDEVYVIEGIIREFKDKKEISVESVTKVDGTEVLQTAPEMDTSDTSEAGAIPEPTSDGASQEALETVKDALELFDGNVPETKFNQLTSSLDVTNLKLAMNELGVVLKDGKYMQENPA